MIFIIAFRQAENRLEEGRDVSQSGPSVTPPVSTGGMVTPKQPKVIGRGLFDVYVF